MGKPNSRENLEPIGFFDLGIRRPRGGPRKPHVQRNATSQEPSGNQSSGEKLSSSPPSLPTQDFSEVLVWLTAAGICIGCGYWFVHYVL